MTLQKMLQIASREAEKQARKADSTNNPERKAERYLLAAFLRMDALLITNQILGQSVDHDLIIRYFTDTLKWAANDERIIK